MGILLREIARKLPTVQLSQQARIDDLLQRAGRIHRQHPQGKNKLYALHAPKVECIAKGKARKPYEFGVKAAVC